MTVEADRADERGLDSPVWSCLSTHHAHLAQGGALARRYRPEYSPFGALAEPAPANMAALESLVGAGEDVALNGPKIPVLPASWEVFRRLRLLQMIRRQPEPLPEGGADIGVLGAPDVDDMLALVDATQPGPFRRRTVEMGRFVGIRRHGRLIAMAGERLWVGNYREVSGVCTHPDAQGAGLAHTLMSHVINQMLRAGQTPFLHVEDGNVRAIALYERLGFVRRIDFPLIAARRVG